MRSVLGYGEFFILAHVVSALLVKGTVDRIEFATEAMALPPFWYVIGSMRWTRAERQYVEWAATQTVEAEKIALKGTGVPTDDRNDAGAEVGSNDPTR